MRKGSVFQIVGFVVYGLSAPSAQAASDTLVRWHAVGVVHGQAVPFTTPAYLPRPLMAGEVIDITLTIDTATPTSDFGTYADYGGAVVNARVAGVDWSVNMTAPLATGSVVIANDDVDYGDLLGMFATTASGPGQTWYELDIDMRNPGGPNPGSGPWQPLNSLALPTTPPDAGYFPGKYFYFGARRDHAGEEYDGGVYFGRIISLTLDTGIPVIHIGLTPRDATQTVGQNYTVTASINDQLADPNAGIQVMFTVVSGPNVGVSGVETTDSAGSATFTYKSANVGTDEIEACFVDVTGVTRCSQTVTNTWTTNVVFCMGIPATIVGTVGDDVIYGTPGTDVINGLDGDDVIYGLDGNDLICGGSGNDKLYGGKGNDKIYGERGMDMLSGGSGNDLLNGGGGKHDRCNGGSNWRKGDTAVGCEFLINIP
jgi:Ca2+-binding RTX toxin-like protein